MLLIFVFFVVHNSFDQVSSVNTKCSIKDFIGKFCVKTTYEPEDIIDDATNKPISINFRSINNAMLLKIPEKYETTSYVEYSSFSVTDSCVRLIDDQYFDKLDKNKNQLKEIKFSKVRCLQSLQTNSFSGVGDSVIKMQFVNMPDLMIIGKDFFDNFPKLQFLAIRITNISSIPMNILQSLPSLAVFNIANNKLSSMPTIPSAKLQLFEVFDAQRNPFHCSCSLMDFIKLMADKMAAKDYSCSTPEYLNKRPLISVGDLCNITTSTTISKMSNVNTGSIQIEIIIAIAAGLLVLIMIIIIVVVCRQKKKKNKNKDEFNHGSPSKIVFQYDENDEPFIQKRSHMV